MADLLLDVINHIVGKGLATQKDKDIFKDYSPDTPDTCIIVYEYAGSPPAAFTTISVRSVQIVVRSIKSQMAKNLAWNTFSVLNPPDGVMPIEERMCIIANRNTPTKIGVDEKNRYLYAFNLGITTNFD